MASSGDAAISAAAIESFRARVGEFIAPEPIGVGVRVGIAASKFNGEITRRLLEGSLAALGERGVAVADTTLVWAPGAFELPMLAYALATSVTPVDAVITLGAVIRGDTSHYDLVAGECARGVHAVQFLTRVPIAFGVLTTNDLDQALARSQPDESNKGREAAHTALEMVAALRAGALAR